MPWLQLIINTTRENAPTLEDHLLTAGAVSVTLQDNADQPILEPGLGETPLWDNTRLTGLFDAQTDTKQATVAITDAYGRDLPNHKWEQLEDKDWEREWMSTYKPIQCGDQLWICPSWCEPPAPNATNLMLDPGLAFGTGTHPTTFLCLQWLDQTHCSGKTVIDYGCGSGILGIASLLLGAESACGIDIDPQALIATAKNTETNNLSAERFPVYLPGKGSPAPCDIMLANILAGPLVELATTISALTKDGGMICLSGILASQAEAVINAYTPWFDFDPVAQKEEWVRLTAQKRRS
ncbi:50S ribosomal protein L11 methyltransferase [Marinibactrum halimedae]|uniref:Ribosomal protein L11 methyltransferase n=1 Tax=Marinibactrum halimedae TaxID=1444977 RepID=A0AA37WLG2_9GAMM|nr:50S ribosomal protein L11 methyltransferase [Marinibactrum halimedae]MCD9459938.1 50S ribosomal protein L11 methyltransferase [Marinibactrum halimedae]GLS25205.1 ribosomal protein L11 methyltransferase [Marinibactrum halimedae]